MHARSLVSRASFAIKGHSLVSHETFPSSHHATFVLVNCYSMMSQRSLRGVNNDTLPVNSNAIPVIDGDAGNSDSTRQSASASDRTPPDHISDTALKEKSAASLQQPGLDTQHPLTPVEPCTAIHTTEPNSNESEKQLSGERPARWDRWQDSWLPEMTCCCFAAVLLIAACIVLGIANDKPLSWWPWNWQISSALALLTALMEAALLFSITSCLGQLSWLWYSTDKGESNMNLISFERISHAFTPLGAVSFMVHRVAWW